jgi:hypothetical protein
MISLLISNLFLLREGVGCYIFGILQIAAYATAALGYLLRNFAVAPRPLRLAYHFCLVNFAGLAGLVRFLRGKREAVWETSR